MKFLHLILTVAVLALAGCQSAGTVTLPRMPAWVAPANPAIVTGAELRVAAWAQVGAVPTFLSDAAYVRVNRGWLDNYVTWTWHAAKALDLEYTANSFDCEDFTLAFSLFASRAAAKAGVKAAPLVARLVVEWDPPHYRHALIGVVTDEGIVIVEPQPDAGPFRITPLHEYRRQILSITFGDFNP